MQFWLLGLLDLPNLCTLGIRLLGYRYFQAALKVNRAPTFPETCAWMFPILELFTFSMDGTFNIPLLNWNIHSTLQLEHINFKWVTEISTTRLIKSLPISWKIKRKPGLNPLFFAILGKNIFLIFEDLKEISSDP